MKRTTYMPFIAVSFALLLFYFLYYYDNKYTAGPPYGKDGIFEFTGEDLNQPLLLIDGWKFYPDEFLSPADLRSRPASDQHTFIGEYSNFSQIKKGHTPFGEATYQLILSSHDLQSILALDIPEIFTDYTLWAGDNIIASTGGSRFVTFSMDEEISLVLAVKNNRHYYSGLVYPPVLGTPAVIEKVIRIQTLFYGILCITSITLVFFSAVLWMNCKEEKLFFHYGILCLAFALSCLHPLFRDSSYNPLWYALEDGSKLLFFAQAAAIAIIASGYADSSWFTHMIRPATLIVSLSACFIIILIIPFRPEIIGVYNVFIQKWYILLWLLLTVCAFMGKHNTQALCMFPLCAGIVLGIGLLSNLSDNNFYEPLYTGWQYEYSGFIMVILFSGMMIWRNHIILKENKELTMHMEELVIKKTTQLETVLSERKNFFSDMAHSLKSPLAAIHSYINIIMEHCICTDQELMNYLESIDAKNMEMNRRIQSLNTLNAFDRIHSPWICLSLTALMKKLKDTYEPEAFAAGIYFHVNLPSTDKQIFAQEEKIMLLFENLIYNALAFTMEGDTIMVSAESTDTAAIISVTDTGIGISEEHLSHIFERFYTIRNNPEEGSGLGLYIVRLSIEEMGGSIDVTSVLGEGSTFSVTLPLLSRSS